MTPDLHRRLRVLRLRQRVEGCSWVVYTQCFGLPHRGAYHSQVRKRLALLPAWAQDDAVDDFTELRATARRLAHVYAECCEVLHGRRAFTELPEPVVTAWEAAVDAGERLIDERCR